MPDGDSVTGPRYGHGTIAWTELLAADVAAQRAFYGRLFGWRFDDRDRAWTASAGRLVAAIRRSDVCGWIPHIAVDDVATVERAVAMVGGSTRNGGGPHNVVELEDPIGARFAVWDGHRIGDDHALNELGGLAWNEIWTADAVATIAFYRGVIGWNLKEQGGYTMFAGRDRPSWTHAGIRPLATGASWVSYIEVAHCAGALEAARALGADIAIPATHVPGVGWIAVCVDREGSRLGLMQTGA